MPANQRKINKNNKLKNSDFKLFQTAKIKKCCVLLKRLNILEYFKNKSQNKNNIPPCKDEVILIPIVKIKKINLSKINNKPVSLNSESQARKSDRIKIKYGDEENIFRKKYSFICGKRNRNPNSKYIARKYIRKNYKPERKPRKKHQNFGKKLEARKKIEKKSSETTLQDKTKISANNEKDNNFIENDSLTKNTHSKCKLDNILDKSNTQDKDHLLNLAPDNEEIISYYEDIFVSSSTDDKFPVVQQNIVESANEKVVIKEPQIFSPNLISGDSVNVDIALDSDNVNSKEESPIEIVDISNVTEVAHTNQEFHEIIVSSSTDEEIRLGIKTKNIKTEIKVVEPEIKVVEPEINNDIIKGINPKSIESRKEQVDSNVSNEIIRKNESELFDRNIVQKEKQNFLTDDKCNETNCDIDKINQNSNANIVVHTKFENKETQTPKYFKRIPRIRTKLRRKSEKLKESTREQNIYIPKKMDSKKESQVKNIISDSKSDPAQFLDTTIKCPENLPIQFSEVKYPENLIQNSSATTQQELSLLDEININRNYLVPPQNANNNSYDNEVQIATTEVPPQINYDVFTCNKMTEKILTVVTERIDNYETSEQIFEPENQIQPNASNCDIHTNIPNAHQVEIYPNNIFDQQYTSKVLESIQIIPPYVKPNHPDAQIPVQFTQNNQTYVNTPCPNFNAGSFICLDNFTLPSSTTVMKINYEKLPGILARPGTSIQNYDCTDSLITTHPLFVQDNNNYNDAVNNCYDEVIESNKYFNIIESVNVNQVPGILTGTLENCNNLNENSEKTIQEYQHAKQQIEEENQNINEKISLNSNLEENHYQNQQTKEENQNIIETNPLISNIYEENSNTCSLENNIKPLDSSITHKHIKKGRTWSIKKKTPTGDENYYSTKITIISDPSPSLFCSALSSDEISETSSEKAVPLTSSSSMRTSPSSSSLLSSCSQATEINLTGSKVVLEGNSEIISFAKSDNHNNDENDLKLQRAFGILSQCKVNLIKLDLKQLLNSKSNDSYYDHTSAEEQAECETENEEENIKYDDTEEEQQQQEFIINQDEIEEFKINSDNNDNSQFKIASTRTVATTIADNFMEEQDQNITNYQGAVDHTKSKHIEQREKYVKDKEKCKNSVDFNSEIEFEIPETVGVNEIKQVQDLRQEDVGTCSESSDSKGNIAENEINIDRNSVCSTPESSNIDEIEKQNVIVVPRMSESKDKLIAIENNELLLRKEKRNLNEETNLKPKLNNEEMIEIIDFDKDFEIEGELTTLPGHSTNSVNSIIIKRKFDAIENNENKISNSQNFLPFKKRYIPPVSIKPRKVTRKKKIAASKNHNRNSTKKICRPIFEPPQNPQNLINMLDRPIEIEILSQAQVNEISSTQVSPPHQEFTSHRPRPDQGQQIHQEHESEEEQESEQEITPQKKYENLTVDLYYDSAFTDVELLAENIVKKQITEDLSKERKRKQQQQQRKQHEKCVINELLSTTSSSSSSTSSSFSCNNAGTSNNRNKNNRKKNLKTDINNVQGEKFFRAQAGINENSNDEFRTGLAEIIKNESDTSKKLFRALMETETERASKTNEKINKINEKIEIEEMQMNELILKLYSLRTRKTTTAAATEEKIVMDPKISSSGVEDIIVEESGKENKKLNLKSVKIRIARNKAISKALGENSKSRVNNTLRNPITIKSNVPAENKKEKKFFHHNEKHISVGTMMQNSKPKYNTRSKRRPEKIPSPNIFDFSASQSSPSNSDDPTKEVIKDLIKTGRAQIVKYKKGSGTLQTKFKNRKPPKKRPPKIELKPILDIDGINYGNENHLVKMSENSNNDDNFDNISIHSDANVNTNSYSNLAEHQINNRAALSPYSQLMSNPRKIKDKKILLALAKSFVRRFQERQNNESPLARTSDAASNYEDKSDTQYGLKPSHGIITSSSKDNQQKKNQLIKKTNSLNNSNIENMQPSFGKSKAFTETNPRKGNPYRTPLKPINIIDVINLPLLAYNNSTPIHKSAVFSPFSPPKSTNKRVSFSNCTKGKENYIDSSYEITNLFGFDEDIEQENEVDQVNDTQHIKHSKNILHNKLKKLKRLVPDKKLKHVNETAKSTRYSINKIRSAFKDPVVTSKQKNIRDILCSTMKKSSKDDNIHPDFNSQNNSDFINLLDKDSEVFENLKENEGNKEIFDIFESNSFLTKNLKRTYERPKRKCCKLITSDSEEENEVEQPKKKSKHVKHNKHDNELEKFYNDFNKDCSEVENFEILIE